jgi:hypothetical protein
LDQFNIEVQKYHESNDVIQTASTNSPSTQIILLIEHLFGQILIQITFSGGFENEFHPLFRTLVSEIFENGFIIDIEIVVVSVIDSPELGSLNVSQSCHFPI